MALDAVKLRECLLRNSVRFILEHPPSGARWPMLKEGPKSGRDKPFPSIAREGLSRSAPPVHQVDHRLRPWSVLAFFARLSMKEIAISKFKATCLEVLERVRKTRTPILVTRFGKPIAEVQPPSASKPAGDWLGSLAGTAKILGDIVSPASDADDWEVLKK